MGSSSPREADLPAYAKTLIRVKAKQLCKKPGFSRSDEEDLQQELALQLARKWDQFDAGRASLNTFVARVVDSAIAMILRDRMRKKRAAGLFAESIDAPLADGQARSTSRAQVIGATDQARRHSCETQSDLHRVERAMDVKGVLANLPPNLRELCRRLVDGTEASVAREMGISRRQMQKLMREVRQHFTSSGLSND